MTGAELLAAVYERQGETLAKLDAIDARLGVQDRRISRHGHRLRRLELRWARMVALFTLAGGALGTAWEFVRGRN